MPHLSTDKIHEADATVRDFKDLVCQDLRTQETTLKPKEQEPHVPFLYQSTKTYGHDRGFSCAFRQWRADSHCRLIHGSTSVDGA